ncbi:RDD family protein [bacterium]|nr:RDD family protein [bacterium]
MSDDQVTIETPEHIEVQYELAGIGSRALAGIFDFLLQGTLTVLVVWGLIWLGLVLKLQDMLGVVGAIIVASMGFLAFTVYYVTAEMLTGGQSPGKRIAGLRVIGVDGRPITFLQSALRNVIRAVDMMPFFYSVGLVSVFASSRAQRLGDMVAGTIVVKERLYALPEQTAPLADETAPQPLPPQVEARLRGSLHLLTAADVAAAERVVERRHELQPPLRRQLVRQIGEALLAKMPHVPPADFPDQERFLEAVVRLWRERRL